MPSSLSTLSLVPEQSSVLHQLALPVFEFDNQLRLTVESMKQVMGDEG